VQSLRQRKEAFGALVTALRQPLLSNWALSASLDARAGNGSGHFDQVVTGIVTNGDVGEIAFSQCPVQSSSPSVCVRVAASSTGPALVRSSGGDMATHALPHTAPIALIVEDDPLVRHLAAALLEESDMRVIECEDAEQAFAALCRHGEEIAMIFADVRLPGLLDGVDLAQRAQVLWPRIRLVITTGFPGERLGSLPDNVVYMPKPWLALEVLIQAEQAADRARAWRPAS
jgi:CheY-like chemotaxis protein